jgi:hypothetical protein
MVIQLITLFTPFMPLPSFQAKSNSAVLPALPPNVTTPFFVSTLLEFLAISHYTFDKCGYA